MCGCARIIVTNQPGTAWFQVLISVHAFSRAEGRATKDGSNKDRTGQTSHNISSIVKCQPQGNYHVSCVMLKLSLLVSSHQNSSAAGLQQRTKSAKVSRLMPVLAG